MFFSATTKNLNQEILTQNSVTFKRWDGVKDEKLWYYGWVHWKIQSLGGGGGAWKTKISGELKMGA